MTYVTPSVTLIGCTFTIVLGGTGQHATRQSDHRELAGRICRDGVVGQPSRHCH
jgi:hypothetical protein